MKLERGELSGYWCWVKLTQQQVFNALDALPLDHYTLPNGGMLYEKLMVREARYMPAHFEGAITGRPVKLEELNGALCVVGSVYRDPEHLDVCVVRADIKVIDAICKVLEGDEFLQLETCVEKIADKITLSLTRGVGTIAVKEYTESEIRETSLRDLFIELADRCEGIEQEELARAMLRLADRMAETSDASHMVIKDGKLTWEEKDELSVDAQVVLEGIKKAGKISPTLLWRKIDMTASQTMAACEELYEAGMVMRSDSTLIDETTVLMAVPLDKEVSRG